MKLFVVAAVLGVCTAGRLDRNYLPPGTSGAASAYSSGAGSFNSGSGGYNSGTSTYQGGSFGASSRPQDAHAHTLRESSEVNDHGFSYDFETSNGIRAQQHGEATNGVQSQGSFAYKGDDGHDYSITYTADENGFRPQGAHLPTSPPVPEAILRALEQNARDEAAGIFDDGSYHESAQQYHASAQQYKAPTQPSREYLTPAAQKNAPSFNSQTGYHY